MSEWKIKGNQLYILIDDVMRIRIPKVLEDYQKFLQYDFRQYTKDDCLCFEFNPEVIRTRNRLQFTVASFNVKAMNLKNGDVLQCELSEDFYGFRLRKVEQKE